MFFNLNLLFDIQLFFLHNSELCKLLRPKHQDLFLYMYIYISKESKLKRKSVSYVLLLILLLIFVLHERFLSPKFQSTLSRRG